MTQEKTTQNTTTNLTNDNKKCSKSKGYFWVILFIIFIIIIFYYWYKLPHPTMVEPTATQNVVAEQAVTTFVNHDKTAPHQESQFAETNQKQNMPRLVQDPTQNDKPLQGEQFEVPSEGGEIAQPVNIIAPRHQTAN